MGEGIKTINKFKKIFIGGMWGMGDTCTKENFYNFFIKTLIKWDLGKEKKFKNSIKEREEKEEGDRLLA